MQKFEELKLMVLQTEMDMKKFYDGNDSAGTRLRRQLQNVRAKCREIRNEVQDIRRGRKSNNKS